MEHPRRIAIVHEWFTSMRGGEKCVEALCELYPDATVHALLHIPGSVSPTIERKQIRTSFIQQLPFARRKYRHYLPLFPTAVRRFRMEEFDLIISSHHCVAKGVPTPAHALHLCYCYTPMRYIWSQYDEYFGRGRSSPLTRAGMRLAVNYLRRFDLQTAGQPHHFIAISENIRKRIRDIYHRESDLVYPPVDTGALELSRRDDGFLFIVSALVPYKRVDLAVEACNRTGRKLVVIGDGPDLEKLRRMAKSHVQILGWQPDQVVRDHFARCHAVIFPGEEDFGIVPLEAMACGKPVVALGRGGALETVVETPELKTGVFFMEPETDALVEALRRLDTIAFDPESLRRQALRFDRQAFKDSMRDYISRRWHEFRSR